MVSVLRRWLMMETAGTRLFVFRDRVSSFLSLKIATEISPESELPEKSSTLSSVKTPISSGITPVRFSEDRVSEARDLRLQRAVTDGKPCKSKPLSCARDRWRLKLARAKETTRLPSHRLKRESLRVRFFFAFGDEKQNSGREVEDDELVSRSSLCQTGS
ncbi:hypothetical protein Bca4012_064873 [Brassica carinata]